LKYPMKMPKKFKPFLQPSILLRKKSEQVLMTVLKRYSFMTEQT
jgi:hypothetical protein